MSDVNLTTTERLALLTEVERAAIRARLDAATEGPWFQGREDRQYESARDVYSERETTETSHDIATYCWSDADAALIAHAPTDLRALLTENQRLRDTIQTAKADAWAEGFQDGLRQDGEGEDGPRYVNPYRLGVSGE